MHISWARLASFCHLGFISNPLIVSKFHNETHDPKGQENKIYTIVKGRETFYRRHTVPVTSCSEVNNILKRVSFGSKDCTKELKLECAYFLGQDAFIGTERRTCQWNFRTTDCRPTHDTRKKTHNKIQTNMLHEYTHQYCVTMDNDAFSSILSAKEENTPICISKPEKMTKQEIVTLHWKQQT